MTTAHTSLVTIGQPNPQLAAAAASVGAGVVDVERVIDQLTDINQAAVPAVGSAHPEHLRYLIAESLMTLVVSARPATDVPNTALVIGGFCIVLAPGSAYTSANYRWFSERYEDFIYLDRVAIVPAWQGDGIGSAIYRDVERLAALLRPTAQTFALEVNLRPRNDQSLAFHARRGFTEVAQQETKGDVLVSLMTARLSASTSEA